MAENWEHHHSHHHGKKIALTGPCSDLFVLKTPCPKNPPLKNPLKINKIPKKLL